MSQICALVLAAQGGHQHVVDHLIDQDWPAENTEAGGSCISEARISKNEALQQAIVAAVTHQHHEVAFFGIPHDSDSIMQMVGMLLDLSSLDINSADSLTGLTPVCAAGAAVGWNMSRD